MGIFLALGAFAQQPDYFPLQVGNQWIYRSVSRPLRASSWVVEIPSTRTINGTEYFVVTGFPAGSLLLRKNDAGTLVFYDELAKAEKNWAAFGAAVGEAYATEVDPCNNSAVIRTTAGALKSPMGDFDTALQIGYTSTCADAGVTSEAFLPYVGLAERRMSNIAGEQVYSLIYARLGGFTVFSETEAGFSTTLDSSSYQRGTNMTVRMSLRNTQSKPLHLTYPSGQDYDVVFRNEKGDEVYRWSKGRLFAPLFRQVDFFGEKNWVAIILVDLPAGNYTATANPAVNNVRYEGTVSFSVQEGPQ